MVVLPVTVRGFISVANFVTEYFQLKITALRKIILILADILQLNKTTVIASCGCFIKRI